MITVQCDACGRKYKVADKLAGKKIRCKHCEAVIGVPAQVDAQVDSGDEPDLTSVPAEPFSFDRAIANAHKQVSKGDDATGRAAEAENETPEVSLSSFAPNPAYSANRSRSPSRPSVIFSPGACARSLAPLSTLIPGMIPCCSSSFGNGVPSCDDCRIVSS